MRIGIAFDLKTDPSAEWQDEFDSPETIAAIAGALRQLGHDVEELGDGREFLEILLRNPPDLVFNIAEGHGIGRSREARVPAVCEMLGVPYTGSDPLTLAATLDKEWANRRLSVLISVPRQVTYYGPGIWFDPLEDADTLQFGCPLIAKPAWEGSSKGISQSSIIDDATKAHEAVDALWSRFHQPIVVEEFIDGDEVTVGLLGPTNDPRVLGVMRILPRKPTERFIYDHAVKSDCHKHLIYECPAQLPSETIAEIERCARRAYQALGCRDLARIDFRIRDGTPYFLEANPLPGLNPEVGDIALIARGMGVSYQELIGKIVEEATRRLAI